MDIDTREKLRAEADDWKPSRLRPGIENATTEELARLIHRSRRQKFAADTRPVADPTPGALVLGVEAARIGETTGTRVDAHHRYMGIEAKIHAPAPSPKNPFLRGGHIRLVGVNPSANCIVNRSPECPTRGGHEYLRLEVSVARHAIENDTVAPRLRRPRAITKRPNNHGGRPEHVGPGRLQLRDGVRKVIGEKKIVLSKEKDVAAALHLHAPVIGCGLAAGVHGQIFPNDAGIPEGAHDRFRVVSAAVADDEELPI